MQQATVFEKALGNGREMDIQLGNWYKKLLQCMERRRQRRQLLRLDERMLKDIGISRADALNEARKPCWKRP